MTATKPRRQKATSPYSTFTKVTQQVAKRVAEFATPGTLCVEHLGAFTESVYAVVRGHNLRATIQGGRLVDSYTCPTHLTPDSATDYFPGHHWDSLAQAISTCLPDERASTRDLHGLDGYCKVAIYREGVALKPVAYLEMWVDKHPTRYGRVEIKKIKSGTLLALCQAFVAAAGEDPACTAALLDHMEGDRPEVASYLHDARFPPERKAMQPMPTFTF